MIEKIVICDDNLEDANITSEIIKDFRGESISDHNIKIYNKGSNLISDCMEGVIEPNILFIDVEVNKNRGIDIAKRINKILPKCQIVYLSNNLKYATDAYQTEHLYFVTKQELEQRLPEIYKKLASIEKEEDKIVRIELRKNRYVALKKNDIYYLERKGRVTYIHTEKGVFESPILLNELEKMLTDERFIRCHNSYIISMSAIVSYKREEVVMENDVSISISRRYQPIVREKFVKWTKSQMF